MFFFRSEQGQGQCPRSNFKLSELALGSTGKVHQRFMSSMFNSFFGGEPRSGPEAKVTYNIYWKEWR